MSEYNKHSCDFKNESECEEEIENLDLSMEDAEEEEFGGKIGKMKITKKTNINKIVQEKPEAVGVLFESGMMCVGCPMSAGESLEQGCKAHGMSDKEIEKLVDKLNKKIWGKRNEN